MSSARMITCLLAATVCLHSATAATLLPDTISINGSYSQETMLPEVRILYLAVCQLHALDIGYLGSLECKLW